VPAVTAPLFGFLLGVVFAWLSKDDLERSGTALTRPLLVAALFSLLVFAPICTFFLSFAPDWAYAYVVDPQRLPGAVDLSAVLIDAASVPAGFAAAARYARGRRTGSILKLSAVPGLGAVALTLLFSRRLGIQATYAQYHGDFGTRSVSGTPLGYALLWMALVLVCAVGWTVAWMRRSSRAAPPP
jgi:hypothetical protein